MYSLTPKRTRDMIQDHTIHAGQLKRLQQVVWPHDWFTMTDFNDCLKKFVYCLCGLKVQNALSCTSNAECVQIFTGLLSQN